MEHLDLDKSGTISMNEFDSRGVTSTGGGEDDGGATTTAPATTPKDTDGKRSRQLHSFKYE